MRRRQLRYYSLITSLLLLAAFFLPFLEVSDLLDDPWDDDAQAQVQPSDRCELHRRAPAPPDDSPDESNPPGVFAVALPGPALAPSLDSTTDIAPLPAARPERPSFFPRYLERGPPAHI